MFTPDVGALIVFSFTSGFAADAAPPLAMGMSPVKRAQNSVRLRLTNCPTNINLVSF